METNNDIIRVLLINHGFTKIYPNHAAIIDAYAWDYGKRINETQYLYYSFIHGDFTLAMRVDKTGPGAGGTNYQEFEKMTVPKKARTLDQVSNILNFFSTP